MNRGSFRFSLPLARKSISTAITFALLVTAGCGPGKKNPKDKDPDPNVATYRVTANASEYEFLITTNEPYWNFKVELDAKCSGPPEALPPFCDQNKPDWKSTSSFPAGLSNVRIEEEGFPLRPIAHVFFDGKKYLEMLKSAGSSLGDKHTFTLTFYPNSVPKGLTVSGGTLELTVTVSPLIAERQTTTEPFLSPTEKSLFILIEGMRPDSATKEESITYYGNDTTLAEVYLVPGAGNPELFTVESPHVGDSVAGRKNFTLKVRYTAGADQATSQYKATVAIRATTMKRPLYVLLTGQREF